MNHIERAADLFFPVDGSGNVRNVKLSSARMSAAAMAEMLVTAEEQVRSGNARLVADID